MSTSEQDLEKLIARAPKPIRPIAQSLPLYTDVYNQLLVLGDIAIRRYAQDQEHGVNSWSWSGWLTLVMEELGEAAQHALPLDLGQGNLEMHRTRLRTELLDAAAVLVAAIEDLDRSMSNVNIGSSTRGTDGDPGPQHADESRPDDNR